MLEVIAKTKGKATPHIPNSPHTLHSKIDSGTSGNTLPLRTFQQMYRMAESTLNILQPTPHKVYVI